MPDLPRTTDANLLAAITKMQPWQSDSSKGIWVLREPGKQILAYGNRGAELDLSGESGAFRLNAINLRTGRVTAGSQIVQAGGKVVLPGGVVWLVKEN